MKQAFLLVIFNALFAASLAMAQSSDSTSIAQSIAAFTAGNGGSSELCADLNQPMPVNEMEQSQSNWTTMSFSGSTDNTGSTSTDFQSSPCDAAAFLSQFQAFLSSNVHLDPSSFKDFQSLINNLHFDPALVSKLEMLAQDAHCDFNLQTGGSESDENTGDMEEGSEQNGGDFDEDNLPTAIPEPSSVLLLLSGVVVVGGACWRRRAG